MHSKSHNVEFMSYDNVNDVVDKLLKTPLSRYQDNLETSIVILFSIQLNFRITNIAE